MITHCWPKFCATVLGFAATLFFSSSALSIDIKCEPIANAVKLARAQPKVHIAIDSSFLRGADPKAPLLHEMVIERTAYSSLVSGPKAGSMSQSELKGTQWDDMLDVARGLMFWIAMSESQCSESSNATVAGRAARLYAHSEGSGATAEYFKFWIDSATGLPLKLWSDLPGDSAANILGTLSANKKAEKAVAAILPKRLVTSSAYLYGELVNPLDGLKVEAKADAVLRAILNSN